ncbi:MAG TPA: hypothetical protein VIV60_17180, partial [Polyangiaceae bacterium]
RRRMSERHGVRRESVHAGCERNGAPRLSGVIRTCGVEQAAATSLLQLSPQPTEFGGFELASIAVPPVVTFPPCPVTEAAALPPELSEAIGLDPPVAGPPPAVFVIDVELVLLAASLPPSVELAASAVPPVVVAVIEVATLPPLLGLGADVLPSS